MMRPMLVGAVAALSLCGRPRAQEAPAPAPSAAQIKACVGQMDLGNSWSFNWKLLEIGTPRLARNSYEALYAPPGAHRDHAYGYPVHVIFSVNGRPDIEAVYWVIRDAGGHWQIPAVCTIR